MNSPLLQAKLHSSILKTFYNNKKNSTGSNYFDRRKTCSWYQDKDKYFYKFFVEQQKNVLLNGIIHLFLYENHFLSGPQFS